MTNDKLAFICFKRQNWQKRGQNTQILSVLSVIHDELSWYGSLQSLKNDIPVNFDMMFCWIVISSECIHLNTKTSSFWQITFICLNNKTKLGLVAIILSRMKTFASFSKPGALWLIKYWVLISIRTLLQRWLDYPVAAADLNI